jgi:hypothetical protein
VLPPVIRAIIVLMIEAARTSEMLVDIQLRTRQHIPEDSELHTRRRENLKSHIFNCLLELPAWFFSSPSGKECDYISHLAMAVFLSVHVLYSRLLIIKVIVNTLVSYSGASYTSCSLRCVIVVP